MYGILECSRMFANIQMFRCSMFANVRIFANIRMFGCSMFECSLKFDCSKDRMFACSMFECSLIYFSNPCSRNRMFADYERILEYRTQMFIVRWALTKITIIKPLMVILNPVFSPYPWIVNKLLCKFNFECRNYVCRRKMAIVDEKKNYCRWKNIFVDEI